MRLFGRIAVMLFLPAFGGSLLNFSEACAYTYKVIYNFCGVENCTNGVAPQGNLLMDPSGNLYGATQVGGAYNNGVVFELSPAAGSWTEIVLHSFCRNSGCPDGLDPTIEAIDTSGNIYGTDFGGGSNKGSVFRLTLVSDDKWTFQTLHRFCVTGRCKDGDSPRALTYQDASSGALYDGVSPLYGVAQYGGANGGGTAFQLSPVSGHANWKVKTLYDFCSINCATDAWAPIALEDNADGSLVGASSFGGKGAGNGSIFRLAMNGRRWHEKVLYNFGSDGSAGLIPNSLVVDSLGNFIGTTEEGGNVGFLGQTGVVYKYMPSSGQYTAVYKFCAQFNCPDGAAPVGITTDKDENIFGAAALGGDIEYTDEGGGVIYAIDPSFRLLHTFCTDSTCTDGMFPLGTILIDHSGNLFGTASQGGAHNAGVVYELTR